MSLVIRFVLGCVACTALIITGCDSGASSKPSAVQIPVAPAERQKAAQEEVNKSMEVMKTTMEASGKTVPGGNMPGFQLPPPPGGVRTGGTAPTGTPPAGTSTPPSAPAEEKPKEKE